MTRHLGMGTLLAAALALSGTTARAQYHYPAGYGGWGGWGAPATVGGSTAAGMGMFAAGAGAYNEQTAQARATNANTAMQMSNFINANQANVNKMYYQDLARRQQQVNATAESTYKRLHDNPNEYDIHTGDALNVILDELINPKVFSKTLQAATQPIPSDLVKNIPFQKASQAITISLQELLKQGAPDSLRTPDFDSDREEFRGIVAQARKEAKEQGRISPDTLAQARAKIKDVQKKVSQRIAQGTPARREADNFLKALYGLTKMMEHPPIEKFLKGLDKQETTDLAHVLNFMHSLGLRFGAAKGADQEAVYDQLYPVLDNLRDQLTAQQSGSLSPFAAAPPNPQQATQFFSGMDFNHFDPQPDPHGGRTPPPPRPGGPQ